MIEQATAGLNADVFEQPGISRDQMVGLTELLRSFRANAGDTWAEPQPPQVHQGMQSNPHSPCSAHHGNCRFGCIP